MLNFGVQPQLQSLAWITSKWEICEKKLDINLATINHNKTNILEK